MAELGLNPGLPTLAYLRVLSNPLSRLLPLLLPSAAQGVLAIPLLRGKGSDRENFSSAEMFLEKSGAVSVS